MTEAHRITLPDGRVVYTQASDEGPREMVLSAPGALGSVLAPLYRARLVIERVDGGAITDHDRQHLEDVVVAVKQHDVRTEAEAALRGTMFNRRCDRNDAAAITSTAKSAA